MNRSHPRRNGAAGRVGALMWLAALGLVPLLAAGGGATAAPARGPGPALPAYGQLPLSFVANLGQTDSRAAFVAHGRGYTLFVNSTETVFVAQPPPAGRALAARLRSERGVAAGVSSRSGAGTPVAVHMRLIGADPASVMEGEEQTSRVNYFIGHDRQKWRTGVPAYARVRSRGVYPGVDLLFYGNGRQFEYDFIVAPGADPRAIRLGVDGVVGSEGSPALHVDSRGDLVLRTTGGDLRLRRPLAYQEVRGTRRPVAARYVLQTTAGSTAATAEVGIEVAAWDRSLPLVIDPVLDYATYLGGSGSDAGMAIAVDATGHAYVAGYTESPDFPAAAGPAPTGTRKAFVAKLDPTGSALVYATYLGGDGDDTATGLAVDADGNAYVTGLTESTDFPTVNAYQTNQGGTDVFVTKLDPSGSTILYSTYVGGSGADAGLGLAVDAAGRIYVTGYTESADFPRLSAYQRPAGGGDAFAVKLNPHASGAASLVYSTPLGGTGRDEGHAIAVDAQGQAHLTGLTDSTTFPNRNAYSKNKPGTDAFVTKLSAAGSALLYSTFLGGGGTDVGLGIALDAGGNVYVTGYTDSPDFPAKIPYQGTAQGGTDAFLTRLNPAGIGTASLLSSTYLGGAGADAGLGVAVGLDGHVYVAGYTDAANFPSLRGAPGGPGTRDAFVVRLQPGAASPLIYSTRVGGAGSDEAYAIALDADGNAHVTGLTRSADFPTERALATTLGGAQDAFVAKLIEPPPGVDLIVSSLSATASGATLTITETIRNEGTLAVGPTTTRYYLSPDATVDATDVLLGSRTVATLEGEATSSASTTLPIPPGPPAGAYFIIARADAEEAIAERNEDNNTASTPFTLGPDLAVSTVTAPIQGGAGTPITVQDTTVNQGARPSVASLTRFHLSSDATPDGADILLGSRAVPVLDPGTASSDSTTLTIPAGIPPGAYFVIARADAEGANGETDEGNNTASSSAAIAVGPDLVVSTLLAPASAGAGAAAVVGNTIRNQGADGAGPSTVAFYLSSNAILDGADVLLGTRPVPGLAPGATSVASTSLTIPAGTAFGTFFIIAKADAEGAVAEAREDNNTSVSSPVVLGADLVVSTVTGPAAAVPGAKVSVRDTTLNQSATAVGASATRFYFSADAILDDGDIVLGNRPVPALGPGALNTRTTSLTLPAATGGQFYIIARANADGAVAETDTANNTAVSLPIKVGADLVVALTAAPATAGAGTVIAVSSTTRNFGGVSATASTTRFYLSPDAALDAADVAVGSRSIASLAAQNGANTGSTSLTIPAGTAPGNYFLIAKADADDAIVEMDEANNTDARAIAVGSDLAVTQVSAPPHAGSGTTMAVSDTTQNASAGVAAASTTSFYLSTDTALDPGDIFLGSRPVPALAGGASSTATTVLTIPAGAPPGRYHVIATADGIAAIPEPDEANNVRASGEVKLGPDLVVDALTAAANGAPGGGVTVTDTIVNYGGGAAGPFVVKFYFSLDDTLDAGDAYLGSRTVAGVAPGPPWQSMSGSTDLVLPPAETGGTHFIIAVVDADQAVAEQDESNNVRPRSIIIGADMVVWLDLPAGSIFGAPGSPLAITDFTRNQSDIAVGESTTNFFLSADATLDASDTLLGSRAVPALGPGEISTGSNALTLPAGISGDYHILAEANADGAVPEFNRGNNVAATSRTVRIGADLVVFLDTPGAASPGEEGSPLSVTDTTRNDSVLASVASTTNFYLSEDGAVDPADVLLGSRAVPALAPGEASTVTTAFVVPAWLSGLYRVIAESDAELAVTDLVLKGSEVQVAITATSPPPGPVPVLTVTDSTANQTAGPVSESTTTFYLSLDGALDAGDVPLGSRTVPALAPGESSTASTTVAIPAGVAGTYRVIAQSDLGNAVTSLVVEGANLLVAAEGGGISSAPGSTIAVTDFTKNEATVGAGASATGFYLSADDMLDAGDAFLASRAVPALAPGETSRADTTLTLPATAFGTFYVIARADAPDAVPEYDKTNNTAAKAILIGADLIVRSVSAPSKAGAGMSIQVTDVTVNLSAAAAGATTTRFYLSINAKLDADDVLLGSRAVPALGAPSTAITTLTIPASTATGKYAILAVADATSSVIEADETNNVTASASIKIGPDLVVDALVAPVGAGAGQMITVTDTIVNYSPATAGPSTVRFYFSTDANLDAADPVIGSRSVPSIPGGLPFPTNTGSTTVTVPAALAGGSYYIIARADADDAVAEIHEDNNVRARPLVIGPDLIVHLDLAGSSSSVASGGTISVTDVTKNDSASPAGPSVTRFYLSPDAVLDPSDTVLGNRAIPALAAGATSSAPSTLTIPPGLVGTYYVIAKADADEAVAETARDNNVSAARTLAIGGDLIVWIDVPGGVANSAAGATVTVADWTRSDNAAGVGASTTTFYLITGTTLDASAVVLGSRAIPALGPSTTNTGTTVLTLPASASGTYRIIAKADADGAVVEANEGNNVSGVSLPFTLGPDLVAWLDVPASSSTPATGATIAVTVQTRNDAATAAPGTTTRLYYSAVVTLDASAAMVGSLAIPALAAGQTHTGTISFTLPAGDVGTRYLFARADADGAVVEPNEDNNASAAKPITIGGDLIVTIDVPGGVANSAAGATVTVADWTRSDNSAPVGASTTKFYLITGTTLDAGAVVLGSRAIPALGPSTTNTGTTVLTLPASASGTYRIIAKADANNTVVEANEGNNVSGMSLPFKVGPDLVAWLDLAGAMAFPGAGATVTVTGYTRNDAATAAPGTTTRLYYSAAAVWDASAVMVGSRAVPALGTGQVSSGPMSFTLPAADVGVRYLFVKADADGAVVEPNEGNNVSAAGTLTIGGDLIVTIDVPGGVANSAAGATVTVADWTRSDNSAPVGASTTKFYLITGTTLDAGAVVLGSRAIPALGPSTTNTGTTVLTLPASASGTYRIIAKADANNTVVEANEGNNASGASLPFTVGPDLVAWLDVPAGSTFPATGATIAVTVQTRNDAGTAAPGTTTRLYYSASATLDASAAMVGSVAVPALAAGQVHTGPISFALPAGDVGTRYLYAKADADSAVVEANEGNNASGAKTIAIGGDLIVTIDVPGGVANSAAGATVTVADWTRSDNAAGVGASTTTFYLITGTTLDASAVVLGSRAIPALGPSTTNTGTTVLTLPASASGTYRIIAKADANNTVVEANEGNNASGASLPFTLGADLVAWLDVPAASSTPATGATIAVTVQTRNDAGTAAPGTTTRLYYSAVGTLDVSAAMVGSLAIPVLAAGQTHTGTISFTLPAGDVGTRYLFARADADGAVVEPNEANNVSGAKTVTIGGDLIVWIDVPAVTGSTVTVTDWTRSDNAAGVGPSTTRFYLVTGTGLDGSAIPLGSRAIPALGPSTTNSGTTTLTFPGVLGTYRIVARADADDAVVEASESNNVSAASLPFILGADLKAFLDLPGAHAQVAAGSTISITDLTKNEGIVPTAASTISFYLSADGTLDGGDVPLGGRAVPPLAGGATSTASTPLTLPTGIAGIYRIIAVVDPDGTVPELDETDNVTVSASFEVGADLTISGTTVPVKAGPGGTINVSGITKNRGGAGAPASTTRIYLSGDPFLDEDDLLLGSLAIPPLAAGVYSADTTPVAIPPEAPAGSYFIIVVADAGEAIGESDETNNALAKPIEILPDLRVSVLSAPSKAFPGTTITVSDTTRNQGAGLGPSTTSLFLSTDAILDEGDLLLGSRAVPALALDEISSASTQVAIPAATPGGTYYLIAVADSEGAVAELNETNNATSRTLTIGPDLIVEGSTFAVPSSARVGVTITASETTLNQGSAAPASTTAFYLSLANVRAPGDPLLASRSVPALGLGGASSASTLLTIPAGTTPGNYYIIVESDAGNAVAELTETNNARARAIAINP